MRGIILLLLLVIALPLEAMAADLSIRPFLVDVTMVPRESTTETILIENNYDDRNATVYATVTRFRLVLTALLKNSSLR